MNYNITDTNLYVAMDYGGMPSSLLISKFEETDMGPDEDFYDDYARNTLVDRRPDNNMFEYEEPRGAVNKSAGRLQLQYYGHRGNADDPAHPELFSGEAGPESQDPRGINVDPDFKELRKQEQARMRFVKWDTDGDDSITGLGVSQAQMRDIKQDVFKNTRNRLVIFDRQIDGRIMGLNKVFGKKSTVNKYLVAKCYGDMIKDAGSVQHKANIICKQIIRDSRQYREEAADGNFEVAKYSQLGRRQTRKNTSKHDSMRLDGTLADGDNTKQFKTCAILMSNILRSRHQLQNDIDFAGQKDSVHRATPFARDLAIVLRSMANDDEFGAHDNTIAFKSARPKDTTETSRMVIHNHLAPYHYVNAELMYKSVKPGADIGLVRERVIVDINAPDIEWAKPNKSKMMKIVSGAKLDTKSDADSTESLRTVNYKTKICAAAVQAGLTQDDTDLQHSDPTQTRRRPWANYSNPSTNDICTSIEFQDNSYKERLGGSIGKKYMTRYQDRDSNTNEFAD